MNKRFVYLPLLLLVTNIQAGPKRNNTKRGQEEQIARELQTVGSRSLLPTDSDQRTEQQAESVHSQESPLAPNPLSAHEFDSDGCFDDFSSAARSQRTSPLPQSSRNFALEATPAIACQTTMRNFNLSSPQSALPKIDSQEDTMVAGVDDMVEIPRSLIQKLEEQARQGKSFIDSTVSSAKEALENYGVITAFEKTQDLASNLMLTRLERILSLDNSHALRNYLEKFEEEADQGEWLAKGLAQAVERKKIDDITRMLEIIHAQKLTNFVPTQHQEDASQILLRHAKKLNSLILPQTQRVSNPGDLSPRSRASESTLQGIYLAHNPTGNPELFAATVLKQLQEISSQPK